MDSSPQSIRRWTGGVFLAVALLMLILGLTLLKSRLTGYSYIYYWMTCFGLTVLAACTALVDIVSIRRSARDEQEELIEETLEKIEHDQEDTREKGSDSK